MKNVLILGGALVLCCGVAGESKAFDCRLAEDNSRVSCYDAGGKEIFNKVAVSGWNYDEATNTFTSKGGSKIVVDNSNNSIKYNAGGKTFGWANEDYNYTFNAGGNVTQISQYNGYGVIFAETYDPNTRKRTSETRTYSDGSGVAHTYDPNTGRETSYANTDANGYTRTTTYDGNGISASNITGRTLTDSNGKPVNGTVTSGKYTYTAVNGVYTGYTYTNTDSNGNSEINSYYANEGYIGTSYTDADGNPLNGFVVGGGNGWSIGGCDWGCLWEDGKLITRSFRGKSEAYVRCEGGHYPCPGEVMAYRPNENGGYSKMTCTDSSLTNCTTEQFDKKGKLIAEYDNDNQLINKYDYDNSGNLAGTYDDQCVLQSCSSGHLEKNGSCIPAATGCGAGYKQIENWCNHIQWTPAEAAAVLNDDNNNSVTITFRK